MFSLLINFWLKKKQQQQQRFFFTEKTTTTLFPWFRVHFTLLRLYEQLLYPKPPGHESFMQISFYYFTSYAYVYSNVAISFSKFKSQILGLCFSFFIFNPMLIHNEIYFLFLKIINCIILHEKMRDFGSSFLFLMISKNNGVPFHVHSNGRSLP